MSVIVFDTKEHADEAVAYPLPPLPGVTPLTVQIREGMASACSDTRVNSSPSRLASSADRPSCTVADGNP